MAFLRQVLKQGNRYYCLVESYRDENGRPQQRCLQWLGTYAAAINRCEQSAQLRPYLLRLAELEGRYHLPDSPPLPPRQYQVIYADPPWAHRRNSGRYQTRRNMPTYQRLSFVQLVALPLRELTEQQAYLFLWTTNTHMPESCQLLDAWGNFELKTIVTWVKVCKGDRTKPKLGMGDWVRNCTEHLLIATRGNPPSFGARGLATGTAIPSVVFHPITQHNSEKPAVFRELVEQLCPEMTRLELFGRHTPTPGWDVWGNEVGTLTKAYTSEPA